MTKTDRRAYLVEEGMAIAWDSLRTHMTWTQTGRRRKIDGTPQFHKASIKDYARLIQILSELY